MQSKFLLLLFQVDYLGLMINFWAPNVFQLFLLTILKELRKCSALAPKLPGLMILCFKVLIIICKRIRCPKVLDYLIYLEDCKSLNSQAP